MYALIMDEIAVTAAQDLMEINAAADSVVIVHRVLITQSSDAGDAESEMLNVIFQRASTSGSVGSTVTARPLSVGDSAYGGTVERNNTTQGTPGNVVHAENFNIQAGLDWHPTPEERIVISPSGRLVIELPTAPTDSLDVSMTVIVEEIGG